MSIKVRLFFIILCIIPCSVFSQPADRVYTREEYINRYKDEAIKEMSRTGIPASITMAQAILESGDGNSPLARYANNHFGIKCHNWTGPTFIQDDDTRNECFRKYNDSYDSYKDHSEFLLTRSRYAFLFELKSTDYVAWAKGLKKAGYATNPKYPELLIRIIEENSLDDLDKEKKVPKKKHNITTPEQQKIVDSESQDYNNTSLTLKSEVFMHPNKIKYVLARKGDTPQNIANRLNMGVWQIMKYNDLEENTTIEKGTVIFTQPKRKRAKEKEHVVKQGETVWGISQKYGIKLKKLCYLNNITRYTQLEPGSKVLLR